MIFDGLKKTRKQVDGQMAPPPFRLGETMEVELGSVSKKNKGRQVVVLQKRSTDGSFPKKGRQLFVAAKMAPPLGNFLGTPLLVSYTQKNRLPFLSL
jgi:hypothetical protein